MIGIKGVIYNENELHMIHEQLELIRKNLLLAYRDKELHPLDSEAYEVQRHFDTIHRVFNHLNVVDQYLYKEKAQNDEIDLPIRHKKVPVEVTQDSKNPWTFKIKTITGPKTCATADYDYSRGNHGDPDNHDACDDWA